MSNRKLIQQAVYIKSTNEFVISRHVHDFKQFFVEHEGVQYDLHIDGGTDYLHQTTTVDELIEKGAIESYILYNTDSVDDIYNKLLWGSYGKDGKQPLTHKRIKDCSYDHLNSIVKMVYTDEDKPKDTYHEMVIRYWLKHKESIGDTKSDD